MVSIAVAGRLANVDTKFLARGMCANSERPYRFRCWYSLCRGYRMACRHGTEETLQSARKHQIIKEMQAAIAREFAAQSEVPKTVPQKIADLLRELHRRLREASQKTLGSTKPTRTGEGGASPMRGRSGIER